MTMFPIFQFDPNFFKLHWQQLSQASILLPVGFKTTTLSFATDDGAFFIEAKIDTKLSDFLAQSNLAVVIMDKLVPVATDAKYNGAMLIIQFTSFGCGGSAIVPELVPTSPEVVPQSLPSSSENFVPPQDKKFVTKRFVFSASKIKELKDRVIHKIRKEEDNMFPSRVDVVLALIWKCALASALVSKSTSFRKSLMLQAVNLRTRTDPPLPESSMGNLVILFPMAVEKESDLELHELVSKLLTVKVRANKMKKKYQGHDDPQQVIDAMGSDSMNEMFQVRKNLKDFSAFVATSCVNSPFYEIDFGWGKPAWVTSRPKTFVANSIYLFDTKQVGEVEVLMNMLTEEEISALERNQELLQFALVNPAII
ncbi:vinorine synthase-like [Quillaja saponaria]|uniref:Vinorine synthase-like n=1 Tax=Quillaja saponaria TaxID=32244 RepID=A0AAD7L234_QUISA|nr:vinorine synthase-like [Quillaja saponaria]